MFLHETIDRIENDVGHRGFGADSLGIVKFSVIQMIWVAPENLLAAGGDSSLRLNAQQNRDILVTVQPISNKEWYDDNEMLKCVFSPVRNEWSLLHVGFGDLRVQPFASDLCDLTLGCFGRFLMEVRPMTDDDQACSIRSYVWSNPPGAAQY